MELEFVLKNKREIIILAVKGKERHEVGHIFTPSGSGHTTKNAIQVCGFSEAFDLWGCAMFAKPIPTITAIDEDKITGYCTKMTQVKDIQLLFDWGTMPHRFDGDIFGNDGVCVRCYNKPCTCEYDGKKKTLTVKKANDLKLDEVKDVKPKPEG